MSDTWSGKTQIVELKTEIAECALSRWLGFLTVWLPQGIWTTYMEAQGFQCKCFSKQGRSYIIFYDTASKVTQCYFPHILLIKAYMHSTGGDIDPPFNGNQNLGGHVFKKPRYQIA